MKIKTTVLLLMISISLSSYEIKLSDITSLIDSMTMKERVSQLFFLCYPKKRDFKECPGGIIPAKPILKDMYSGKFNAEKHFLKYFIPPFIGIDQEGGMVNRLSFIYKFPPIGELYEDAENQADIIETQVKLMSSLGINVNFSPCVDLSYKRNSYIKRTKRGISENPDSVIAFSKRYMKAHKKKKILNSIKHFPGYGDTYDNSDDFITDYKGTEIQLFENLRIFSSLIKDASFVMMANLRYPSLDTLPALMSKSIVSFVKSQDSTIIVLTDDIACRGYSNPYDVLKKSFNAGCDMFIVMDDTLFGHLTDSMVSWVESGKIQESDLNKRLIKILLKKEYLYQLSKRS
ncbi:MAG: glycoside hydrolase family 3 N-terminal domain-containing protein [bacterium]